MGGASTLRPWPYTGRGCAEEKGCDHRCAALAAEDGRGDVVECGLEGRFACCWPIRVWERYGECEWAALLAAGQAGQGVW